MRALARFALLIFSLVVLTFAMLSAAAAIYYGFIAECQNVPDCLDQPEVAFTFGFVAFSSGLVGLGAFLAARALK